MNNKLKIALISLASSINIFSIYEIVNLILELSSNLSSINGIQYFESNLLLTFFLQLFMFIFISALANFYIVNLCLKNNLSNICLKSLIVCIVILSLIFVAELALFIFNMCSGVESLIRFNYIFSNAIFILILINSIVLFSIIYTLFRKKGSSNPTSM